MQVGSRGQTKSSGLRIRFGMALKILNVSTRMLQNLTHNKRQQCS